jgi:hypothetical protein
MYHAHPFSRKSWATQKHTQHTITTNKIGRFISLEHRQQSQTQVDMCIQHSLPFTSREMGLEKPICLFSMRCGKSYNLNHTARSEYNRVLCRLGASARSSSIKKNISFFRANKICRKIELFSSFFNVYYIFLLNVTRCLSPIP